MIHGIVQDKLCMLIGGRNNMKTVWLLLVIKKWYHWEHGEQIWEDEIVKWKIFETKHKAHEWMVSRRHKDYLYEPTCSEDIERRYKRKDGKAYIHYRIFRQKVF